MNDWLHRIRAWTRLAVCTGTLAAVAATMPCNAQPTWKPERPVVLVVPYSPGGGVDTMARHLAKELQRKWGHSVVVENMPGADGLIGTRRVTGATPDGHTLLVQIPSLTIIKHLPGFKGPDPVAQLAPVSVHAVQSGVFVVHPSVPANNMGELVRYCKSSRVPCSFGTTENSAKLQAQMLAQDVPSMVVVNYKGGGQLVTDLVGNSVNIASMGYTAALPFEKSGKLRVVMYAGKKRTPVLPDVQTAEEAGYPQLQLETWYGLFAPRCVDRIGSSARPPGRQHACGICCTGTRSRRALQRFGTTLSAALKRRGLPCVSPTPYNPQKEIDMSASAKLRAQLASGKLIVAPGAIDGITARAIERAGFSTAYMTGAGTAMTLGYPDYGLITMTEMVANATRIVNSISIPLISDADTGYGNELNVFRTVREFERAGVAAIHIEDQVFPKRCGHLDNKEVVSREDYIAKIRAEIPRRVAGPCLLNVVRGGKTPDVVLSEVEAMGYSIAILPGLLLNGIISTCDALLEETQRIGKYPPTPGDTSPAKGFALFGAAEWDARRTAFRDPPKVEAHELSAVK